MRTVKRRIFAGNVCEQYYYNIPDQVRDPDKYEKKPRFASEKERKDFNWKLIANRHRRKFLATFDTSSLYGTLTFDQENECQYFQDAKRLARNLMKSLRRKFKDSVIWIYTGRGKTTSRIHLHFVSKGIPKEEILKRWPYGSIVKVETLRKHNKYDGLDHGTDWTGLADYLINHWTEEVGGRAWMQSGKASEPDREKPTECLRTYSIAKPPKAPKGYTLVESKATKYGYMWFKYVKLPPQKVKNSLFGSDGRTILS